MTEILGGKTATASVSARSIEALAEAHYPWVQRMCASLTGDVEEGQELAQEVMTVACRYFSTLHDPQAFRPWLKEVARNRFRDWLRKKYREEAALAHAVVAKGGSSMVETDDDHLDLRLAIGALPIAQRVPLVLHYFLGLRYREIAGLLGCPVGTVMSRLAAARGKLAKALSEPSGGGDGNASAW